MYDALPLANSDSSMIILSQAADICRLTLGDVN